MNRPRKKDFLLCPVVPAVVRRPWYILFALCLLVPLAFANDFGLVNPAEKEFGEIKPDTKNQGTFVKKSPDFKDRSIPIASAPQKTNAIRQVSTFDDDPFPVVSQPQATQFPAPDWGTAAPGNGMSYDPSAYGGYASPYTAMPNMTMPNMGMQTMTMPDLAMQNMAMQNMYGLGMDPNYFAQYPQQYPPQYMQGYMMNGMNPYANPYENPYAHLYPQSGHVADPYGMMYQAESPAMPTDSSAYHAVMIQEMLRQQAAAEQAGKEKAAEEAKKQAEANWTLNNLMPVRVSSPLGETMLACAKTVSPFCTPSGPDKGVGMPLVGKSWLDHPYYFGGFVGQMTGSQLVDRMIDQKHGGHGGLVFGYNYNDYWGLESRLHFASISISDTNYARRLISEMYPDVTILRTTRTNQLTIFDLAVHYYPLGNAKWRPYCKYGLGFGGQKFTDSFGNRRSLGIATMPMGIGMRYWWNERLAIQGDITDNIIFATGIAKTQNNWGFTIGITYAFGSGRTQHPVHYWPATPSMGSKW